MPLVEVFDISGKKVFSGNGIYIVKVKTEVVKVRI